MATHESRRGDTLSEFWDVEAHDPEGHGSNLALWPTVVTALIAGAGVVVIGATLLAWSWYGAHAALLMLGIAGGVAVLVAFPVGSIVLTRSRAQLEMEQEAIELHAASAAGVNRDTGRLAGNARASEARAVEGVEYPAPEGAPPEPAHTDAIRRMEDEGGPVVSDASRRDEPRRAASTLGSPGG